MSLKENKLYLPIENMFREKDYFSISARKKIREEVAHSPFGVMVHGKVMKVDVVAFKWIDNWQLEANAVECKLGKTWEGAGAALGQATAYQRLFPRVYIASEATETDLKHVDSLLRQLGIGYIFIEGDSAEEIFPPSQNIRFNQGEFERQVKIKAMALLAFKEIFGEENIQFGMADKPNKIWVSDKGIRTCNIFMHLAHDNFEIGLNVEQKAAIQDVFSSLNIETLYSLVSKLPSEYDVVLKKFIGPKILGKTEETERMSVAKIAPQNVENVVKSIQQLNWLVNLQIQKKRKIQIHPALSRQDFIREVGNAQDELSTLYNAFKGILGKRKTSSRKSSEFLN